VTEVIALVRSGGYVDRALEEAAERVASARQAIATLPEGKAKDVLGRLGTYLLGRVTAARD
jgi:geranylgeranyl pyrophosphate synthase